MERCSKTKGIQYNDAWNDTMAPSGKVQKDSRQRQRQMSVVWIESKFSQHKIFWIAFFFFVGGWEFFEIKWKHQLKFFVVLVATNFWTTLWVSREERELNDCFGRSLGAPDVGGSEVGIASRTSYPVAFILFDKKAYQHKRQELFCAQTGFYFCIKRKKTSRNFTSPARRPGSTPRCQLREQPLVAQVLVLPVRLWRHSSTSQCHAHTVSTSQSNPINHNTKYTRKHERNQSRINGAFYHSVTTHISHSN